MFLMIMVSMFIFFILLGMLLINLLISKKIFKSREKISPFECGFDPLSMGRMPFSLQFYLITIIFLIFDVEIAMILPMIESLGLYVVNLNFLLILLILLGGLFLEWKEGALKWFK